MTITTWGSTENGDPVFDNSCWGNLQDINLIITKALSFDLMDKLLSNMHKCILHLTVTGMGGSFIEPYVPTASQNARELKILLDMGFPESQTVLRIDPMISVEVAKYVLDEFNNTGVKRVRFSFLNLTNYTKNDTSNEHVKKMHSDANELIKYSKFKGYTYTFESCAGSWLKNLNVKLVGCMSSKEAEKVLGRVLKFEAGHRNRNYCLAPANRVELLKGAPCNHNCKYYFHLNK